jgi:hypothetical protein
MKKLSILFVILTLAVVALAQTKYKIYNNARFGYSIAYPADLLAPQGEAPNADGQVFTSDEAEMRVYGSNMLLHETLQKEFNAVVGQRGAENVTYKIYRKNFFVVSGAADGRIFYQKTMAKKGSFITFLIEYDEAKKDVYDKAVAQMVKTFK